MAQAIISTMPVIAAHANACQLHCCMPRCDVNGTAVAVVACTPLLRPQLSLCVNVYFAKI